MPTPPNSNSEPGRNTPGKNGDTPGKSAMQPRGWGFLLGIAVLLLINLASATFLLPAAGPQRVDVPYTLFKQQVEAANVGEIASRGDTIQGTFRQPVTVPSTTPGVPDRSATDFATVTPAFADPGLETLLEQQGAVINARSLDQPANPLLSLLLGFGPTVLLIGAFLWLSGRLSNAAGSSGGMFSFGRSRAKRYDQTAAGVARITFADVAGIDEAKEELVEVVDFLKEPNKYTRLGGAVPRGVLLVGPPGTGKTLLARAVAGEANVPFFSMGASEFVEMIVGVGASRVRDLFAQTRAAAPAIIFIDELDAIGRARGTSAGFGANDEREQTLNQILTEMDGFSGREGVIVIAATNRPDVLDQALLRPGRFDRRVVVQPPDRTGRAAILKVHTHGMPLAPDVDLNVVAASTPGLVGADLKNLVNEAALLAARRGEDRVPQKDFLDSLEKLVLGPARSVVLSPAERERVAYHEGGHTLCGLLVPGADPVNRVTIIPRGQALGVTYQRPDDDQHSYSEEYLQARIVGAMGGRAAEEVVYGGRTTGAENDIQQASALARQMVTRWGMSDELGPVTLAPRDDLPAGFGMSKPYSEATALSIDVEVQRMLRESHAEAVRLLEQYRPQLNALAEALLEHETLEEQEILKVTGLPRAPRLYDRPIPIRAAAFRRPA